MEVTVHADPVQSEPRRLSRFIRDYEADILAAWQESCVRRVPEASDLDQPALIDHIPDLLDQIAAAADELVAGGLPQLACDVADRHALARLDEGFDLEQVVQELAALRDCIVRLWSEHAWQGKPDWTGIHALNEAIDKTVTGCIERYIAARDRTVQALDRISLAALETHSLDQFLERLLRVLVDTTAAVDTATILLRDGDLLRVRASAGLDGEVTAGVTVPIGQGFAGTIAKTRRPHFVRDAATEAAVASPIIRDHGVRALYGVPLVHGNELIGVAHMGSTTAYEFSDADRQLFATMTNRAILGIVHHLLRDAATQRSVELDAARTQAERTLAMLDSVLASSSVGIALIDAQLRYVRINDALARINGPTADQHIGHTVREIIGDGAADFLEPLLHRMLKTREPIINLELHGAPPSTPDQIRSFLANYVPVVTSQGELLGIGALVTEITERKRLELELRERELQFRAVADSIPQLAWMADETGTMLWYNRRWYEFTGTTLDTMQGWGWQQVHHPDHLERVMTKFRNHIATGEVWEDTFPLRAADGHYRWFLSRAIPIRDEHGRVIHWFGTNTDITDQRFRSEAIAILSSSLDYRRTLEQIGDLAVPALGDWYAIDLVEDQTIKRVAVAHIDPAKRDLARELARRYPPNGDAMLGVPRVIRTRKSETAAGIDDRWLASMARDQQHLALLRELGVGSYIVVPLVARDRCLGTITLVSADPKRGYTCADIAMLEELGRRAGLAVDNTRLLEEAQRETRMREDILAVVSHDLKNPLGTVHLAATILLDGAEPETRKYVEKIDRAVTRMDHLIGDLLDLASVQTGRLAIERTPVDADILVRETLELHQAMALEKRITLTGSCGLDGGDKLSCDRNRVLQVLCNLCGNALKFCRPGDAVTIQCRREHDKALFTVADTGPGIPDAELPHIFAPYWSAERHVKKGTGLGLYISRGILDAHGERIWVESTTANDSGTSFYFTLPFAATTPTTSAIIP